MEILAEQPPVEQAEQKSFDALASVDMMRFDLQRFGQVLPETRQRVYDEELSSIAEGVERASRTSFVLAREGDDLVYFDRGNWRSYTSTLITGNRVAHAEAKKDPRRQFLAEWSDRDLEIGYSLRKMQPGEILTWTNGYPHDQEARSGAKFMQECGLVSHRKMGFIYRAECMDDGSVVLQSQTIDGSYASGLAAVAAAEQGAGMEQLVSAYDGAVRHETGQAVYAGRTEAMRQENAWHDIQAHRDLIAGLLDGLETIAAMDVSRTELRKRTEQHIIGVWKAFKMRLDNRAAPTNFRAGSPAPASVYAEIQNGFKLAQAQGDIKLACGGKLGGNNMDDEVDLQETFSAIFGKSESSEDRGSWKWKNGVCRVESCPTRPGKTKIGPCEVCVRCQAKFDAGFDPTKTVSTQQESASRPGYDLYAELASLWQKAVKIDTEPSDFELAA